MNVAWLFTGAEIGLKKQKVQDLKKQISQKYGEIESHVFYAYETNCYDVLNLLQSISLFSAPIFIEYRNAELIKDKNEISALQNWIKNASLDNLSFLVLESEEFSINKKLESTFSASQKQIFWEMFENKKHDWIRQFFSSRQMRISEGAIETILDLVENNTEALKNECQHLALFFEKGKLIEDSDIKNLLSHNKDEDVFSLFDALTFSDSEKSFNILNKLILSKNFSSVQLIVGLTYCFRRLLQIQNYLNSTGELPNQNNLRRFGVTSKKAISQNSRALRLWNVEELNQIILLLNNCDLQIRKMGNSLQNTLLEILLLKIVKKELQLFEVETL